MTPDQEERLVLAFESMARTLERIAEKVAPPKKLPSEATIMYTKSYEEELQENQGNTGETTIEDWTSLGPRERAFIEREERARSKSNHSK